MTCTCLSVSLKQVFGWFLFLFFLLFTSVNWVLKQIAYFLLFVKFNCPFGTYNFKRIVTSAEIFSYNFALEKIQFFELYEYTQKKQVSSKWQQYRKNLGQKYKILLIIFGQKSKLWSKYKSYVQICVRASASILPKFFSKMLPKK